MDSLLNLEHNTTHFLATTHDPSKCAGQPCSIHNRSNHSMRMFPQHWRGDRMLMERICPHGIGHPDPDHLSHTERVHGLEAMLIEAIHGCDGCCR